MGERRQPEDRKGVFVEVTGQQERASAGKDRIHKDQEGLDSCRSGWSR